MSIMNIYSEETVLLAANSSKYTLTPVPIVNGKRVILTVSDLNEDDDMGVIGAEQHSLTASCFR